MSVCGRSANITAHNKNWCRTIRSAAAVVALSYIMNWWPSAFQLALFLSLNTLMRSRALRKHRIFSPLRLLVQNAKIDINTLMMLSFWFRIDFLMFCHHFYYYLYLCSLFVPWVPFAHLRKSIKPTSTDYNISISDHLFLDV